MREEIPFKSLASFYFWYFAAVGALMPYLGLFLVERGCSAAQVGSVNALPAVMRICTPYLWGALADRTQRRMRVVQQALFAASVCIGALGLVTDFGSIALWLVLYGVFINGTLAQFEIVTFKHLAERQAQFPRVRLWASVGFLLAVLAMGPLFDRVSVLTLPLWVAGAYLVCWGFAMRIPEPQHMPNQHGTGNLMSVLRRRSVQSLLLVGLLMQLSCGPFNAFFSIYVGEHGYSRTSTGLLQVLVVSVPEVLDAQRLHHISIPTYRSMGPRRGVRSRPVAPGPDARRRSNPQTNRRAPVRNAQSVDGSDALPDEDAAERAN